MKKIFLGIAICLLAAFASNAQTFDEWFKQQSTQQKYLLQQIAALKVYSQYAKKGYEITNDGLNSIRSIKKGEFNLHNAFYTSLKNVSPAIKGYQKISEVFVQQIKIISQAKKTIKVLKSSSQLTPGEISYCIAVFNNLLEECIKTIDELILVITSGLLEMKDDERLKRIDKVYADMQDKYSFSAAFSTQLKLLTTQRLTEQAEINYSKNLNRIK